MNIQKNALLVTKVSATVEGWQFRCTSVPMTVPESEASIDRFFDSNGDVLTVETIYGDSRFGDNQRVEEEAFEQTLLYVSSKESSSPSDTPFWLTPVWPVEVDVCKCKIRIDKFNLFKAAGFQMACWSRFLWGNIFFDDPTTPKEHAAKALKNRLKIGDAIPVKIDGFVNGVAILEAESAAD